MKTPLIPSPLKQREAHFKQKIAHQKAKPLGTAPTPTTKPRAIPDPLKTKGGK